MNFNNENNNFQKTTLIKRTIRKKHIKDKHNKKIVSEIPFYKSIKLRFIVGILLPVVGIIVLGAISYDKASVAVINGYQNSAVQTVSSIENYLDLVSETVHSTYKPYLVDLDLLSYFNGLLKIQSTDSSLEEHEITRKRFAEEFHKKANSDILVEDIMFLSDEQESITTNRLEKNVKPYTEFMNSDCGKVLKKDKYAFHWFGNNNTIDKKIGANKENYAFRLARKVDDIDAVMLIDIEKKIILDAIDDLDTGDKGYAGVVLADGSEILSTANSNEKEKVFYNETFYKEAIKATDKEDSENSGIKKVVYKGKSYRFIYTRLSRKQFMVCALISEDYLISKVKDIQSVTIIVVLVASIIAGVVGFVIVNGVISVINKIINGLNKVAIGDFTSEIDIKREDEFRLITDAVNHTVANVKELISSVQEVNGELVQAADRVYNSSVIFVDTSENIKNSVGEINTGAYKLDDDSVNCLKQMDMLSDKIETVTSDTEHIGTIASNTDKSIAIGISTMDGVAHASTQTTRITGEVIDAIEALQVNSRSIRKIVNVIN